VTWKYALSSRQGRLRRASKWVSRTFNDRTKEKSLVERYTTHGYTQYYLPVQCLMTVRTSEGDDASSSLETDIFFKLGSSDVILAALGFYDDGERNGDSDSVVETVKWYERESSSRYILTVTASDDVGTSLNGSELIAMSVGGCLQFWVACRREKKLQIMHALVS